jgi:hypothetical protein
MSSAISFFNRVSSEPSFRFIKASAQIPHTGGEGSPWSVGSGDSNAVGYRTRHRAQTVKAAGR